MNLLKQTRATALNEIKKFGAPHLIHFEISEDKASWLAKKLNANEKIVMMGVYLMDLKIGQAMQEGKLAQHVEMSATASKTFLKLFDIDEATREKIINCVEAHHGAVPFSCLEAEICANADCYRFLHPKGFFLFLTMLGKRGLDYHDVLEMAEMKLDEKHKLLSLKPSQDELEDVYHTLKTYIQMAKN